MRPHLRPRPTRVLALCLPALLAACADHKVAVFNTPPAISIVRPLDGDAFEPDDVIEIEAVAEDSQDPPEELRLYWTSSLDGDLGEGSPDSNGEVYLALSELSSGTHALTLTVVDTDGESASQSVGFDVGYGGNTGAPTVILVSPTEGEAFTVGQAVTVFGTVTDEEQAWDTLELTLSSSREGNLWVGNAASTGTVTVDLAAGLGEGTHVLTLSAEDQDGNVGSASVSVDVMADGRPTAAITSPTDGGVYAYTETLSLQGTVSDAETDTELLQVTWESDLDGLLGSGNPDSSGFTAVGTALSVGVHTLTLTAIDHELKEGSDSIVVSVQDPLDVDDDGDGWTENMGDCDDEDGTTYPSAAEACDTMDNDCDDQVNEDWWDTYEPDDRSADAYDLGDVDGTLWTGDSLTLSAITLHGEGDEDWFEWDAHDDFLIDNVSITVRVTGLPAAGNYVLELYQVDGSSYELQGSDDGSGSLSVSFEGDVFDGDEDDWAIRFYSTTWPSGSCTTTYSISISS